jgi:uracil-DNA glycosylase
MSPAPQKQFSALPFIPTRHSLSTLRKAAQDCEGCQLFQHAIQTVFGEGIVHAPIMLVGEQPGDQEDIAGKPFVGPTGKLLDQCLVEAGIERKQTYVTNIVTLQVGAAGETPHPREAESDGNCRLQTVART